METFKLDPEQREVLCSMEKITLEDVTSLMQSMSSGKIRRQEIGRFTVKNKFVPSLRNSGLMDYEGQYVFSAIEKCQKSLFSKATYRLFVWPILSDTVFAVPVESCEFDFNLIEIEKVETPVYGRVEHIPWTVLVRFDCRIISKAACQRAYVLTTECQRRIRFTFHSAGSNYYGRRNVTVHACQLFREFELKKKYIEAVSDVVKYMMTEESSEYTGERSFKPMYALRHDIVPKEGEEV